MGTATLANASVEIRRYLAGAAGTEGLAGAAGTAGETGEAGTAGATGAAGFATALLRSAGGMGENVLSVRPSTFALLA